MTVKIIILVIAAAIMIWRVSAAVKRSKSNHPPQRVPGPDVKTASIPGRPGSVPGKSAAAPPASPEEVTWAHWAQFFTKQEFKIFLDLVAAYFQKHGKAVKINAAEGTLTVEQGQVLESGSIGLHNLAQMCRQSERKDWEGVIAQHFDALIAGQQDEKDLELKRGDFNAIAALIHVKIYPEEYASQSPHLIARQYLEGTIALPVYDLPNSVRNVTPEEAKVWGKSDDELFALGLANLRKNYPADIEEHKFKDGMAIKVISGNDFFVNSHVLLLGFYPGMIGPYGSLIGIPNRHILLCYPIQNLEVINAVSAFIPMLQGMYRDGPGSTSPNLYWYHDKKFTNLPYKFDDLKKMEFIPPGEFVELLTKLGAKEKPEKGTLH